jgi:hypothetical protein
MKNTRPELGRTSDPLKYKKGESPFLIQRHDVGKPGAGLMHDMGYEL